MGAPTTTSKGLGRLCARDTYPGGAIRSVPSPRTPRAAPAVAWAGWLTPTAEPWLDPEAREGRARRGPGRRSLTPGAGCPGSRSPCDLRAAERAGERTAGASWGRKRVATAPTDGRRGKGRLAEKQLSELDWASALFAAPADCQTCSLLGGVASARNKNDKGHHFHPHFPPSPAFHQAPYGHSSSPHFPLVR